MKISAVPDACAGHGRCSILCPEVFDSDDRGYVVIKLSEVPKELEVKVREAVFSCPEAALLLEE